VLKLSPPALNKPMTVVNAINTMFAGKISCYLLACVLAVITVGCGGRDVGLVRVEGKIVRSDGKPWPQKGILFFAPIAAAEGFPLRGAHAKFDTDGSFTATSFEPGDGVLPGIYSVSVQCWEASNDGNMSQAMKSAVPGKYQQGSRSGLKLEVPADDSQTLMVEYQIPIS
jgi:hypothetical protein